MKDDKNSSNGLQRIYHTLDQKGAPDPIHKHLQYYAAINELLSKKRIIPDMAGSTESYDKTLLKEMKNSVSQLISKSGDIAVGSTCEHAMLCCKVDVDCFFVQ